MFNHADHTTEDYAQIAAEYPATDQAARLSVNIVRRVVLTILEEHGVDTNTIDKNALTEHVNLLLVAGTTAGEVALYEQLQQTEKSLKEQDFYQMMTKATPMLQMGIDTGLAAMVTIAQGSSHDFAVELRDLFKAFVDQHPMKSVD